MGKLKWTPYEYYTSSPCEFYYACKGYFDEKEDNVLLMRKVAQFASVGFVKDTDFNSAWPLQHSEQKETVLITKEDKEAILRIHNAANNGK